MTPDHLVLYTSPIFEARSSIVVHQIALIGEMEKIAMVSTSRIENIVVKGEDASNDFAVLTIELFLSGSQGEDLVPSNT